MIRPTSNKRLRTEETNENIEPESESSEEYISKNKLNQLQLAQSGGRRSKKASPVAANILNEMGLGLLDSDESNQSSILSNLRQPSSMLKSIPSEISSEPMSNMMAGSNEICIESDSNMDDEHAQDSQSSAASSAEKTLVGAQSFSIHQDYTPANLVPVSRTNFAGLVNTSAASGSSTAHLPTEGRAIRNTSLKKFNEHESNSAKKYKGRSPLATVSNNANVCRVQSPSLGDSDVAKKINQTGADEDSFFMYKRQDPRAYTGEDNFERLSDEMMLSVFKWLPKKTLMRCSLVNHRFNRVAQDESLWTRLDLASKTIQPYALGRILVRGVVILRMAQCKVSLHIFIGRNGVKQCPTNSHFLPLAADLGTDIQTGRNSKRIFHKTPVLGSQHGVRHNRWFGGALLAMQTIEEVEFGACGNRRSGVQRACEQQTNGSPQSSHVPRYHIVRCSKAIPPHETVNDV